MLDSLFTKFGDDFAKFLAKIGSKGQGKPVGRLLKLGADGNFEDDVFRHLKDIDYSDSELDILETYVIFNNKNVFDNLKAPNQNVKRVFESPRTNILREGNIVAEDGAVLLQGTARGFGLGHIRKRHIGEFAKGTKFQFFDGRYLEEEEVLELIQKCLKDGDIYASDAKKLILRMDLNGYTEDTMVVIIRRNGDEGGNIVTSHLGLPIVQN